MSETLETKEKLIQKTIDCFWETIPPSWHQIRANIRGIVTEKFDITVEQFHILRHLRQGIASVSELAEAKQISRPAISQAVNILVENGLVTRKQSSEDRRFVLLELTDSGSELLNIIHRLNRRWMEERLSGLNESELQAMLAAMALIRNTFGPPPTE
jgi:DNA-binding MarR family transcriptional regulator